MTESDLPAGAGASATEQRVWAMMERHAQEMDRHAQEMDRHALEMRDLRERQEETARQQKETDRLLTKQAEDADRRFREADGAFDSRWGRFLESLVEGDLVPLLRARGIDVDTTSTR